MKIVVLQFYEYEKYYYLEPTRNEALFKAGVKRILGKSYYFDNYKPLTGAQNIFEDIYEFDSDGKYIRMIKGKDTYLIKSEGNMLYSLLIQSPGYQTNVHLSSSTCINRTAANDKLADWLSCGCLMVQGLDYIGKHWYYFNQEKLIFLPLGAIAIW